MATLYTIGHSTRSLEDLISALHAHDIKTLVDIRSFPVSRRLPHFNRESLETALPADGIQYVWIKALGGYRKRIRDDSPNTALRSANFRNYADHMRAERVWFHCHRMLVSDWLVAHGHTVLHIDAERPPRPHRLTAEARLVNNQLLYPSTTLFT
jgi:uncharacterized protein (DUF488 family)